MAVTIRLAQASMKTLVGLAISRLTSSISALALSYWILALRALKVGGTGAGVASGEQGSAGCPIEARLAATGIHKVAGELDIGQPTQLCVASRPQMQRKWLATNLCIIQAANKACNSRCPAQVQLTALEVQHIVGPWSGTRGLVAHVNNKLCTASTTLKAQCVPDAIIDTAASHTHQALTTATVKAVLHISS